MYNGCRLYQGLGSLFCFSFSAEPTYVHTYFQPWRFGNFIGWSTGTPMKRLCLFCLLALLLMHYLFAFVPLLDGWCIPACGLHRDTVGLGFDFLGFLRNADIGNTENYQLLSLIGQHQQRIMHQKISYYAVPRRFIRYFMMPNWFSTYMQHITN